MPAPAAASNTHFPALTGRTVVLKLDPAPFQETLDGLKRFEIRFDDREYQCGDLLILCETAKPNAALLQGEDAVKTGRSTVRRVTSILRGPVWGLAEGWVVMSTVAVVDALPHDELLSCLARMQVEAERLQSELDAARAASERGRVLTDELTADVTALAGYVEQSEAAHYREIAEEDPDAAGKHIFLVAKRVRDSLN